MKKTLITKTSITSIALLLTLMQSCGAINQSSQRQVGRLQNKKEFSSKKSNSRVSRNQTNSNRLEKNSNRANTDNTRQEAIDRSEKKQRNSTRSNTK